MTVIVGLLDSGKVWIGGDSASTAGWDRRGVGDLKTFRNGEYLIGVAGQPRVAQLLRYSLNPPTPKEGQLTTEEDFDHFLCVDFVNSLRQCLKDGGIAEKDKDVEGFSSNFLVGQYYVAPAVDGFAAVGCGDNYAMGALHATAGRPPEERIATALEAAARFSAGVAPPFFIKNL